MAYSDFLRRARPSVAPTSSRAGDVPFEDFDHPGIHGMPLSTAASHAAFSQTAMSDQMQQSTYPWSGPSTLDPLSSGIQPHLTHWDLDQGSYHGMQQHHSPWSATLPVSQGYPIQYQPSSHPQPLVPSNVPSNVPFAPRPTTLQATRSYGSSEGTEVPSQQVKTEEPAQASSVDPPTVEESGKTITSDALSLPAKEKTLLPKDPPPRATRKRARREISANESDAEEPEEEQNSEDEESFRQLERTRGKRIRTTLENANFECDTCGKLFRKQHNLTSHLRTHNPARPHPHACDYPDCDKAFVRRTDLVRHQRSVHLKTLEFKCPFCAMRFSRRDTLRRHCEVGCANRPIVGVREAGESASRASNPSPSRSTRAEASNDPTSSEGATSEEEDSPAEDDE